MKENPTILVIDDDASNLTSVCKILRKEGYQVRGVDSGDAGIAAMSKYDIDLVLTDLKMEGLDGIDVLTSIRAQYPHVEVILMTAHGTIERAVQAMREGAFDFITKPFERMILIKAIKQALEKQGLLRENLRLRQEVEAYRLSRKIVGSGKEIRSLMEQIQQVAPSSSTVLVTGESGTGKELVAQALHDTSNRSQLPFIKVSCTTLPEALLEAELFGYEKGAFTGAHSRKLGRFELAAGGTLFLDEIGELPAPVQGKLLRVLQEGEFERLGSNETLHVDVRIVAATNRDLMGEVQSGRFREDLYYRLNVIHVKVPSLRDRIEDVPMLVEHFIRKYSQENQKQVEGVDEKALAALESHRWPGNIRELENAIERAVVHCRSNQINIEELPETIFGRSEDFRGNERIEVPIGMPLEQVEQLLIKEMLKRTGGDKKRAAELLGIARRTIYRKLGQA